MIKSQARIRIDKLRQEIDHHRYLYHVKDSPEISDAALDSLKKELANLEDKYPDLITPDSPTQRVGGQVRSDLPSLTHASRMLSLADAFNYSDLVAWEQRNQKIIPAEYKYFIELKIDGVAVSLIYQDGQLVKAATRGDGIHGEDVTHTIRTIEAIPLSLTNQQSGRLEVRGEVYLLTQDFEDLNKLQKAAGKTAYANPRNFAAGSIRHINPALAAARPLRFFAWEISDGVDVPSRAVEYEELQKLGFPVPPNAKLVKNLKAAHKYLDQLEEQRTQQPFQIDGAVIKINDLAIAKRLGVVGKTPRASIAYKFPAEEGTTLVQDIIIQVGRTGALTPVAHLKPISIAGTTVARASLHNADELARKDIRVGDTVIIRKAGDIIPEIVTVLPKLRPIDSKPFKFPNQCPVCQTPVEKSSTDVIVKCPNSNCSSLQAGRLRHAVSRSAFDIDGLGEKIIDQLLAADLITDVADLWSLTVADLLELEGFAEQSAHKLVDAIQSRKKISFDKFLIALSIPGVGTQTAQDLGRAFENITQLKHASVDQISQVEGIGPKTAQAIFDYFQSPLAHTLLTKFTTHGIKPQKIPKQTAGQLAEKTFLFTGTLPNLTRPEAKQRVQALGGQVTSTLSKRVDYVVIGEDPGSKAQSAQRMKLKTLTPDQFLQKLG